MALNHPETTIALTGAAIEAQRFDSRKFGTLLKAANIDASIDRVIDNFVITHAAAFDHLKPEFERLGALRVLWPEVSAAKDAITQLKNKKEIFFKEIPPVLKLFEEQVVDDSRLYYGDRAMVELHEIVVTDLLSEYGSNQAAYDFGRMNDSRTLTPQAVAAVLNTKFDIHDDTIATEVTNRIKAAVKAAFEAAIHANKEKGQGVSL